jgi:hypothetical protein
MIDYNSAQPWIRNIEVILGPLGELDLSQGPPKPNPNNGKRIFSDGSQAGLRVRFTVKKHIVSTGAPTTIEIYNLSESTRQAIKNKLTSVAINVGYANITGMRNIFSGSVLSCFSYREGADIVTSLSALQFYGGLTQICKIEMMPDNEGIAQSGQIIVGADKLTKKVEFHSSGADGSGMTLYGIVKTLGQSIAGVFFDPELVIVPNVTFSGKGLAFRGQIQDILNKLARQYGFSWFIDAARFYAVTDGSAISTRPVIISSDNGYLIRAEPMFEGPAQGQIGVSITSVLNPLIDIKPGARVQLKSTINPGLNNAANQTYISNDQGLGYIVTDLTHSGDSHSSQWQTHMECKYMGVRK